MLIDRNLWKEFNMNVYQEKEAGVRSLFCFNLSGRTPEKATLRRAWDESTPQVIIWHK